MDRLINILKSLTEAFGPPGFEDEVREIVKTEFRGKVNDILTDNMGSVIGVKKGTSERPKILFVAHMDEVGFMVKGTTKEGFVKFVPLGGWLPTELIGTRVRLRTKTGEYIGVIGTLPPHVRRDEEAKKMPKLKDLYMDFGVSEGFNPIEKFNIRIGDPIVPYSKFQVMGNEKLAVAKAFDDRVGVAHIIRVLDEIQTVTHPNTVYLAAVVQEEVGLRGAATTPWIVEPDVAIAVDVSIAEDVPGLNSFTDAKLGKGVSIVVQDRTMIAHRRFRDFIVELADKENIPYHLVTVQGGYDTGRIHLFKEGVPSAILGIPSRYIHSFHSVINLDDLEAAVRLAVTIIKNLDEEIAKDFKTF